MDHSQSWELGINFRPSIQIKDLDLTLIFALDIELLLDSSIG